MITLQIPDEIAKQAGLTNREAAVQLSCRLFQTGRLSLFFAAQLAGLSKPEFEDVLLERKIPLYVYTEDELRDDLKNMKGREKRDKYNPLIRPAANVRKHAQ